MTRAAGEAAGQVAQESPMVEFSYFFEDWRETDGINFPHKVRRASGGETTEEWTIKDACRARVGQCSAD
ncbi:MAG: hypothetical protein ABIS06_00735 [Vicinamibacterales bacterium]